MSWQPPPGFSNLSETAQRDFLRGELKRLRDRPIYDKVDDSTDDDEVEILDQPPAKRVKFEIPTAPPKEQLTPYDVYKLDEAERRHRERVERGRARAEKNREIAKAKLLAHKRHKAIEHRIYNVLKGKYGAFENTKLYERKGHEEAMKDPYYYRWFTGKYADPLILAKFSKPHIKYYPLPDIAAQGYETMTHHLSKFKAPSTHPNAFYQKLHPKAAAEMIPMMQARGATRPEYINPKTVLGWSNVQHLKQLVRNYGVYERSVIADRIKSINEAKGDTRVLRRIPLQADPPYVDREDRNGYNALVDQFFSCIADHGYDSAMSRWNHTDTRNPGPMSVWDPTMHPEHFDHSKAGYGRNRIYTKFIPTYEQYKLAIETWKDRKSRELENDLNPDETQHVPETENRKHLYRVKHYRLKLWAENYYNNKKK